METGRREVSKPKLKVCPIEHFNFLHQTFVPFMIHLYDRHLYDRQLDY